jgi:hypothetical protein
MKNTTKLFNNKKIRTKWDENQEKWFFSIVDVIAILTESTVPKRYWSDLKIKLKQEGFESYDKIVQLKLLSSDGKYYLTDVADTEQLLRLIQSIPSKNAEPFKIWLAKVGNERINEIYDPELTIKRALKTYINKGYSLEFINQRLKSIEIRKELTDVWERCGITDEFEFAILTDELTKAWSDLSVKEYKKLKNLTKENLRDNMSNIELVLNMLAEISTKEITNVENPTDFEKIKELTKEGGEVAKEAKEKIEKRIKKSIITSKNLFLK